MALSQHKTIRSALISLGIAAKGTNYKRAKNIRFAENLERKQTLTLKKLKESYVKTNRFICEEIIKENKDKDKSKF